jgi:ketosteroid isomerase-like protein
MATTTIGLRARALAMACTASLAVVYGCAAPAPTGAAASASAFHAALIAAYNRCDEKAFTSAYADSFSFTTSNTRSAVTTLPGLQAYLAAGCRQSPPPHVTLKSEAVRRFGSQAVAHGQYVFRIARGGALVDVTQNYTLVLVAVAEGWRIGAHHVSLAP